MIDYLIVLLIGLIPIVTASIISSDINNIYNCTNIYLLICFIGMIFKDVIFENRSIGKKIMNIEIINKDGNKTKYIVLLLRNLFLIIWPIEMLIFMIRGERLADIIFKTSINISNDSDKKSCIKKNKILLIIFALIILSLISILNIKYNQLPTVYLSDNLIVNQFQDVTNLSFVTKVEDGTIISDEKKINTSKSGQKEVILIIKNKLGKKYKYKYFITIIES